MHGSIEKIVCGWVFEGTISASFIKVVQILRVIGFHVELYQTYDGMS
jgi:hypothetical protein